ncbi:uncharacterized protein SCHCODRAFT_02019322 [Schizophyllum commune H4-8]|uniref:uncharacterized protein n=1 Tax=Schizophyllum commune (strain H4-8 / FGSC 9210) TaxID=578458 RepID=UPI00215DDB36|nr:uncharacterized protein SCHCODRAFT_02019322 [Schizophyllum commune H4-8]KAI5899754.1 hypothetical protein SCHCODRAFT_02019322 [Schizophyllum commune H4-8]
MSHDSTELGNDSGHELDEEGSSGCVNVPRTGSYYSTLLFRGMGGGERGEERKEEQAEEAGRTLPRFPVIFALRRSLRVRGSRLWHLKCYI